MAIKFTDARQPPNPRPRSAPVPAQQPIAKPETVTKRKPGRPLAKDKPMTLAATQPWIAEGMSRRTWFYRQKEARKN